MSILAGPAHRAHNQRLLSAVQDATLAASIHNSQPWRFVLSPHSIEVWLDLTHRPSVIDAQGRWAMQSIGATLANLELGVRCRLERSAEIRLVEGAAVAALEHGTGTLEQLAEAPIAVVTVGTGPDLPGEQEVRLHDAIAERRTTRWPSVQPVDEATLRGLGSAARGSVASAGVTLAFPDADQTSAILALTADVDRDWRNDVAYLAEIERWADHGEGLGIPAGSRGPADADHHFAGRDFAVGVSQPGDAPPAEHFEAVPQMILLRTPGDSPLDWVHAGAALQRLMLDATAAGVDVGVLGQLVETPASRRQAGVLLGGADGGTVQQVVRLGRTDHAHHLPVTPRKPLESVVTWHKEP